MAGPEKTRLISCRCTYCGAPIEVAFGQKTATCPYCDTTFFVEQGKDANSSFREDDDSVRDYEYGTGNYKKDTADPFVEIVQTAVGYMENRAAAREKKRLIKEILKESKLSEN